MNTLILGLGNPILSDDGVGIKIAHELQDLVHDTGITVIESSKSGFSLLELLIDYDRAIIIDAIQTQEGKAGCIYRLGLGELQESSRVTHGHSVNLTDAIRFGRRLGFKLPRQIIIFAIEVDDISNFSERLTAEVQKAVPLCLNMIIRELGIAKNIICESSSPEYTDS